MNERTIAIGDIHGFFAAFAALIEAIDPLPRDMLVRRGDFVDRGIDSKGLLDQLIALADRCRLVPILGNHDAMMNHARDGRSDNRFWIDCGGDATLDSYGSLSRLALVPREHMQFLKSCVPYYETDTHLFLHATYNLRK